MTRREAAACLTAVRSLGAQAEGCGDRALAAVCRLCERLLLERRTVPNRGGSDSSGPAGGSMGSHALPCVPRTPFVGALAPEIREAAQDAAGCRRSDERPAGRLKVRAGLRPGPSVRSCASEGPLA